jgi:hypothetical protein
VLFLLVCALGLPEGSIYVLLAAYHAPVTMSMGTSILPYVHGPGSNFHGLSVLQVVACCMQQQGLFVRAATAMYQALLCHRLETALGPMYCLYVDVWICPL